MKNAISSDLYKLRKSNYFYVCLIISIILSIATVFLMDFAFKNIEQNSTSEQGGVTVEIGNEVTSEADTDALMNAPTGSSSMATFFGSSSAALLLAVVISLFVGSEFNNGTIKNSASTNLSRSKLYASKTIVGVLAGLFYFLVSGIIATCFATFLWGFGDISAGFWSDTLLSIGVQGLIIAAYISVFTMFSMLIRQNGGSLAANICFLEFLTLIVQLMMFAAKQLFGWEINLTQYLLDVNMTNVATNFTSKIFIQGALVALGYFVVTYIIGVTSFKARDIK